MTSPTTHPEGARDATPDQCPARPRALLASACLTPWGGAATGLPGAAPVELPKVIGFVTSRFSPLVHAVATDCLGAPGSDRDRIGAAGSRTGIVLATMFGDTVTLDTATRRLTEGQVHSPLLFFQSVTTSVLGHLGRQYGITGPVTCLSVARHGVAEALFSADLMLDEDEVDRVLVIGVELAANERATWVHRRASGPEGLAALPDGDCAAALLLAREPDPDGAPTPLVAADGTTAAGPPQEDVRYRRFGWLASLVAASEAVRPAPGAASAPTPVRVPGPYGYVVGPALSGSAA
ncbi:ketosynthase [Streptomyces sp. NPDC001508]|uniref:ketosynthase n=1 Tax=Streptomyces sp. NPDC001508 TaxID=3154656 RepID=UPI00331E8EF5